MASNEDAGTRVEGTLVSTTRREFIKSAAAATLGFRGLQSLMAADRHSRVAAVGPLLKDPAGLLDLPSGFEYHIVSRTGQEMDDGLLVPGKPDGMAAFNGPDGKTVIVRNHELIYNMTAVGPFGVANERLGRVHRSAIFDAGGGRVPCIGGTVTLLYDQRRRKLERQYLSLAGTQHNCAGGPTPWGTWISCEENVQRAVAPFEQDHGYPFEVPATCDGRLATPEPIKAMGRFRREAVAVDPRTGIVYQTEDRGDGLLYRYVPNKPGQLLAGGRTQVLAIRDQPQCDTRNWEWLALMGFCRMIDVGTILAVEWLDIDHLAAPDDDLRLRGWHAGAARFARGEGIWQGRDGVYVACTIGGPRQLGQVWRYVPSPAEGTAAERSQPGTLELFIEPRNADLLRNCDNVVVAPWGDLVVCEDGEGLAYRNRLIGVTPAGQLYELARNEMSDDEFAGPTFSPDGTTLFVNLQESGVTMAISGPWPRA